MDDVPDYRVMQGGAYPDRSISTLAIVMTLLAVVFIIPGWLLMEHLLSSGVSSFALVCFLGCAVWLFLVVVMWYLSAAYVRRRPGIPLAAQQFVVFQVFLGIILIGTAVLLAIAPDLQRAPAQEGVSAYPLLMAFDMLVFVANVSYITLAQTAGISLPRKIWNGLIFDGVAVAVSVLGMVL